MKYKVTLNGRTYEVEVEAGKAMCVAEYEAYAPAAAPVAAPVVAAPVAAPAAAAPAATPAPAAAPAPVAAPAAPAVAPGTAGQLKLHDVPPKTAAMIMAIVADTMGKPLNELRFISIKEVK